MKYLFIAGLFLSMAAVGLTIRCYVCFGCTTTTQSQLQTCSSTFFDACLMVETFGYAVRSCGVSTLGIGCVEVGILGFSDKTCTCQTDGCNGQTVPGTTTLASTEGPTIRCYVCDGCTTVTQSQLQTCSSTVDACSMVETSGYVVRSCVSSYGHTGCISVNANGISEKICNCETDGCNGQTVPGTTTLASTEGPTIRCYSCVGCNTVTQSQLKDCPSTSFDACSTVETSGYVLRSCSFSATGIGCTLSDLFGINARGCTCDTDGCNGKTVPETTTLTSTESPTIRCYSCVGCNTVTQSQLQDCPSTFSDGCLMVEISGYVVRSCDISDLGTGCTKVDLNGVSANACRCQTDGCNGPTPLKTTTLASTENGSNGGGALKANIVGSLIAVVVEKILLSFSL